MLRIALGENLLVKPTNENLSGWQYKIIDPNDNQIIQQESGISNNYKIISLDRTGIFSSFTSKTLLVKIFNSSKVFIEQDCFLLSRTYEQNQRLNFLVSLLGENSTRKSSSNEIDFQEGFEIRKDIELYESNSFSTIIKQLEWSRDFVEDFKPDHRFQDESDIQKETS